MNKLNIFFANKKITTLTILLWSIATLIWFIVYGFRYDLEGEKYINQADYFLQHQNFEQKRHLFYATTIFIIAAFKFLLLNKMAALLFLLCINLFAYIKLSKALMQFFNNKIVALFVICFLLFFPPFQSWTMYLYTENIFYSLILLLLTQLLLTTSINHKNLFYLFTILFLLIFSRPLGILFIAPLLLFLLIIAKGKQRYYIFASGLLGVIIFYFISQVVFTTTPDWTVQRSFTEENLICDMPTVSSNPTLNLIEDKSQLKVLLYYITHNFNHFLPLALKRLQLFFFNSRSYYSNMHNLYLLLILASIYGFLILKVKYIIKHTPKALFWFIVSIIGLFAASIAVQCDDYHNRFFMSLMPFWVLLVAIGLQSIFFGKQHKN